MSIATFVQPDHAVQTEGTAYKLAIKNAIMVLARLGAMFAPHEQDTPDMTVRLDAGALFSGTVLTEVAAQNTATITAPATYPRIDRVVINSSTGVKSVITGSENSSPVAPAITSGYLPICQVLLQTTSTEITNSMITDERGAMTPPPQAQEAYLVGDLYFTTTAYADSAAVAAALGYGTWVAWGKGRMPVCFDAGTDIAGLSKAAACVVTWNNHGLSTGNIVVFSGITQTQWTAVNGSRSITRLTANTFSIPVNTAGYTLAYNPATDPGIYQDYAFATVEGTGGGKTQSLAHTHALTTTLDVSPYGGPMLVDGNNVPIADGYLGNTGLKKTAAGTSGSGGSAYQDVLNPYIVLCAWKRTA